MYNPICEEAIYGNEYLDLILEYNMDIDERTQPYEPVCVQSISPRFSAFYLDSKRYPPYSVAKYGYSNIPKCFGLMDESSMQASGILQVQNLPALDLRGRGVLIGFVDTGIDYTNPLFQNADKTTRIQSIWDQTIRSENPPERFSYGTEYSKEQINEALRLENPLELVPTKDENGHGTALAGIASGGQEEASDFIGAAPEATIVVVKLKEAKESLKQFHEIYTDHPVYQENDIMLGVRYIIEVAKKLLAPAVICIGVGSNQGARNEGGTLGSFLGRVGENKGICVLSAAGNESQARHHYFGGGKKGNNVEKVEINVGNTEGFSLELWGRSINTYSIAIHSPGGETIPRISAGLIESQEVQLILEETRVRIDYQLVTGSGGDELILVSFRRPTRGVWTIDVYSDELDHSGFHIWLPITPFLTEDTYFIRPNPDATIVLPATSGRLITVTAYNHIRKNLYLQASRGAEERCDVKPDLTAPGVTVSVPNLRHGYTQKSGTSIATAITAGAAVLLMEWGVIRGNLVEMSTSEIKRLLIRGADREDIYSYPNREWGYGTLNLYQTFRRLTRR